MLYHNYIRSTNKKFIFETESLSHNTRTNCSDFRLHVYTRYNICIINLLDLHFTLKQNSSDQRETIRVIRYLIYVRFRSIDQ